MKKHLLAVAFTSLVAPVSSFAAPTVEELWETIKKQQAEIDQLKKEQKETDEKVEATAEAVEQGGVSGSKAGEWATKTKIGGYGEHHYNNFENSDDKIDAHRYVLFISHEYSDTVRFFSELELEHSLSGEGKPGEVELEQAFVEWDFAENHSLVAGQFLIPVGILNDTHEPDTFYGVERNLVEKNIIPTTWWESGALVKGSIAEGLSYDFAFHSGLAVDESGNIRKGRQKSANAKANDFAMTARVKYTGVRGLELAASVQRQENISQGVVEDASALLTEVHAIYNVGMFSIRGLWASWNLDGDEYEALGTDEQNGWYVEPSIKPLDNLGFFVRWSSWNNSAGLSDSEDNEVFDIGVNYWLNPNVVFKLDYQDASDYNDNDSLNIGVGWSY